MVGTPPTRRCTRTRPSSCFVRRYDNYERTARVSRSSRLYNNDSYTVADIPPEISFRYPRSVSVTGSGEIITSIRRVFRV